MAKYTILSLKERNNPLAPCWIAGSSNSKSTVIKVFKRHEINAINVATVCDKLRETIENNNNTPSSEEIQQKLSFDVYSKLVYGALLILRLQVDDLFKETKRLFEYNLNSFWKKHSTSYIRTTQSRKRKVGQINSVLNKKPHLCKPYEESYYARLLNEAEFLSVTANTDTLVQEFVGCSQVLHRSDNTNLIQMSEIQITIREFNSEIELQEEPINDFGNATVDEIAMFENLYIGDKLSDVMPECNQAKRRAVMPTDQIPNKRLNIKTSENIIKSISKSANTELIPNQDKTSNISTSNSQHSNANDNINLQNESSINSHTDLNCSDIGYTLPISLLVSQQSNICSLISDKGKTKNKSKLIIDKQIKLTKMQMVSQINNYFDKLEQHVEKKFRFKSAKHLFAHFKFQKIARIIRNKRSALKSKNSSNSDYAKILREIFTTDFSENKANEIYPKWNQTSVFQNSRKHKSRITPLSEGNVINLHQEQTCTLTTNIEQSNVDENVNLSINLFNNNNSIRTGEKTDVDGNSVYSTMMQLLEIWRCKDNDKIDAIVFLKRKQNRVEAALNFYNLLELARDLFIIITKAPGSIQIGNILFGPKSVKLITTISGEH